MKGEREKDDFLKQTHPAQSDDFHKVPQGNSILTYLIKTGIYCVNGGARLAPLSISGLNLRRMRSGITVVRGNFFSLLIRPRRCEGTMTPLHQVTSSTSFQQISSFKGTIRNSKRLSSFYVNLILNDKIMQN